MQDQKAIDDAIARTLEVWPAIAKGDMEAAMLKLHTKIREGGKGKGEG
jgi:PTH1 family peptidyl-tRNA hydrolase